MESENVLRDIAEAFLAFVEENPTVPVMLYLEFEGLHLALEYRAHLLREDEHRYERQREAWPVAAGI